MNLLNKRNGNIILFLILLMLFLNSCQDKKNTGKASEQTESEHVSTEMKNKLVFGVSKPKDTAVTSQSPKGFTETDKGDIKGQLLPVPSIEQIPEDMVIGPLQNMRQTDKTKDSFAATVENFFSEAEKGYITDDLLHPDWRNAIKRVLGTDMYKTDYSLRMGRIINDDGIKRANIRIISNIGRISGEVIADKYDGRWLLSSISVNFKQLQNLYVRENSEFSPLGYSNILLNY